jgi:SnoaL-like domain
MFDVDRSRPGTHESLLALSVAYARAVDRRDADAFTRVFHEDATLRVGAPSEPDRVVSTIRGHAELREVPLRLAHYDHTFHMLGQASFEPDGDRVVGEVYCVAHHVQSGPAEATDTVMYIRYADTYTLGGGGRGDGDGDWRIADRLVQVDWREIRPVRLAPAPK